MPHRTHKCTNTLYDYEIINCQYLCQFNVWTLKKIGKVLTSKSVGTGPSSYEKRIFRAAVSQRLINIAPAECHDKRLRQHSDAYIQGFCDVASWPRNSPDILVPEDICAKIFRKSITLYWSTQRHIKEELNLPQRRSEDVTLCFCL